MKKMTRPNKLKVNMAFIVCFLLLIWTSFLLGSGPVNKSAKQKVSSIDVDKIESDIQKLRKKIEEIESNTESSGVRLKRDPFATLIITEKRSPIIREDEKENALPDITLFGIVSDRNTSLAIIGDEVKREGEFIGEFEIYKIMEENVLIKYRDKIFPVYIKQ
ncbi:MAG: hypothetical protein NC905_00305 [Candidatus Omnitrophica bacterium]|nr:hypothetical protein [Candidatus Omnitrophota bacterium]